MKKSLLLLVSLASTLALIAFEKPLKEDFKAKNIYVKLDSIALIKQDLRKQWFDVISKQNIQEKNKILSQTKLAKAGAGLTLSEIEEQINVLEQEESVFISALNQKIKIHLELGDVGFTYPVINSCYEPQLSLVDSVLLRNNYLRNSTSKYYAKSDDTSLRFVSKSSYKGVFVDSSVRVNSAVLKAQAWDNSGNVIILDYQILDPVSNQFVNMNRTLYKYLDSTVVEELFQHWDIDKNVWCNEYKITRKAIDTLGRFNEYLDYYVHKDKLWVPDSKTEWEIDLDNVTLTKVDEKYNEENDEWLPEYLMRYAWHDNGEYKNVSYYSFELGTWKAIRSVENDSLGRTVEEINYSYGDKKESFYGTNDDRVTVYYEYNDLLNGFEKRSKESFHIIDSLNIKETIFEEWDRAKEEWGLNRRLSMYYDILGNVIGQRSEDWEPEIKDWIIQSSFMEDINGNTIESFGYTVGHTYSFDENNRKVKEIRYGFDDDNKQWVITRTSYWFFNEAGTEISSSARYYDDGELSRENVDTIFDIEGGITVYETYNVSRNYDDKWDGKKSVRHVFELGYEIKNMFYSCYSNKINWVLNNGFEIYFPQGYEEYGVIPEEIRMEWTSGSSNEYTERYINKIYSLQNGLEQYEKYRWVDNAWLGTEKLSSTFNLHGKFQQQLKQVYVGEWKNSERIDFAYNSLNRLDSVDSHVFYNGQWSLDKRVWYVYDSLGNNIEQIENTNVADCPKGYLYDDFCATCIDNSQSELVVEGFESNLANWSSDGGSIEIVDNPKMSIGGKVLKFVQNTGKQGRLSMKLKHLIRMDYDDVILLDILNQRSGNFDIEFSNSITGEIGTRSDYVYSYGSWESAEFYNRSVNFDMLTIIIPANYSGDSVFYFDNLRYVKDETTYVSYDQGIGIVSSVKGLNYEVVENKDSQGLEVDVVGAFSRSSDYITESGLSLNGDPINLDITISDVEVPIDYSAQFSLWVKSESEGVVRLILKDTNSSNYIMFDQEYYTYEGHWQKLVFNEWGEYGIFNQIVIAFNEGVNNDQIWYFDQLVGNPMIAKDYSERDPTYSLEKTNKNEFIYNSNGKLSGELYSDWLGNSWKTRSGWIDKVDFDEVGNEIEKIKLYQYQGSTDWYGDKLEREYDNENKIIGEFEYEVARDSLYWVMVDGFTIDETKDNSGYVREIERKYLEKESDKYYWKRYEIYYDSLLNRSRSFMQKRFDENTEEWVITDRNIVTDTLVETLHLRTFNGSDWYNDNISGEHTLSRYTKDGLELEYLNEEFEPFTKEWIMQENDIYHYEPEVCEIYPVVAMKDTSSGILCQGDYDLEVGDYGYYLWNDNSFQSTMRISSSGIYYVEVIDSLGCFAIDSIGVAMAKNPIAQEICNVTVIDGNNVIHIDSEGTEAEKFSLFKTNEQGGFDLVLTVDSANVLIIDEASEPELYANTYYLESSMLSGCSSAPSEFHTTIHLTSYLGHSNENHLIWNDYEGGVFYSYDIYRGTRKSNLKKIKTLSNIVNSYTDTDANEGIVYYQVVASGFDCGEAKSNINKGGFIASSINSDVDNRIEISPNPFNSVINVVGDMEIVSFELYDFTGALVYSEYSICETEFMINLDFLESGTYILQTVSIDGKSKMRKVIKN